MKRKIKVVRKLQFSEQLLLKNAVLQAESRKTARLERQLVWGKAPNDRLSNKSIIVLIYFTCVMSAFAQLRSFNEIFPDINDDIRAAAFENNGYVRSSQRSNGFTPMGGEQTSAIDPQIINIVLSKNPLYLVESILVVPVKQGNSDLLDVYNALGNIRGLKGIMYPSHSREREVPLFEDATRIAGEKQTRAIPDPPPALTLPLTETIYVRLKDVNFGNTYYRAEIARVQNGLRYTLSNFRNITYLFLPVIKEEKFTAQLYIEPINEGVLIYSIAGADIPDMFASKINVESAISKRLAVITSWAADGISGRKK